MTLLAELYRPSLTLLTDLYQLTMAYGYWRTGVAEREAVFHLFFRKNPFHGGYGIAAGLEPVIDLCEDFGFDAENLAFLGDLRGNDGQPLFPPEFLAYLGKLAFTCDVDAMPEGTAAFPHEPLLRVRGPVLQGQLLETAVLNMVSFQTLVATKAARICHAAAGEPVLELLGLRRAQGIDGSLAASRAAYLGGCAATSNVLAGRLFGIPVRGTHAHSWVMFFDSEIEAFEAYAAAMPNNCVFLVDTYDTIQGVKHAIAVGQRLRAAGHELAGVRLDSGDLAYLSVEARRLLDEAGFPATAVIASNDLDETLIQSLKAQGATIGVWGIGTKLVTAFDQPALGAVYKLACVRDAAGAWQHRVKLSEQAIKTSNPGIQQVRRFTDASGGFVADAIYDTLAPPAGPCTIVDPIDLTRQKHLASDLAGEDLLQPIFRTGRLVYQRPTLAAIRDRVRAQLAGLHASVKRFDNPHQFPAGLEAGLFAKKLELVRRARGIAP